MKPGRGRPNLRSRSPNLNNVTFLPVLEVGGTFVMPRMVKVPRDGLARKRVTLFRPA